MSTGDSQSAVLRVDLTTERVSRQPIPERWRRKYVGGKGLGARILYEELDAGTDPLGPENALLFMLGPLTGLVPGDPRYVVVTKSPLTGTFVDSYGGGSFPARLAGSLEDTMGVLVTGQAAHPLTLVLGDGGPELVDASDVWGADVPTTAEGYPDAATACIGPAGEKLVAYASIATDGGDHQAARGGVGAVLGAKRLKAVVARGPDNATVDDPPPAIAALQIAAEDRLASGTEHGWQRTSETLETIDFANEMGVLATRGWQASRFEGTDDIGMTAVRASETEREREDEASPGGFRIDDTDTVPRGSTLMTLGAGLGIDDFEAVLSLGSYCDTAGMDVITAGSAVGWAMRASDRGVIDRDIQFGESEVARALLREITGRTTPLGDALADGVAHAADTYGGHDFIPTVKDMELPAYDPRGSPAMALAYATSDRGACHRRSRPVEREVFDEEWSVATGADHVVADQNATAVLWSLIVDDRVATALGDDLGAEWLRALGWDVDADDLAAAGERIWTLTRLFNVREGVDRDADRLPASLTESLPDGPNAGRAIEPARFEELLDAYYHARGWTADGEPSTAVLDRLDLRALVDREEN